MLIIEGRTGKAKEIKRELDNANLRKVLFVNASNIDNPFIVFDKPILYLATIYNYDVIELCKSILITLDENDQYRLFDTIVLYVNCDRADIDVFKYLEQQIKSRYNIQKCILTVQNNDLKQIHKYNM